MRRFAILCCAAGLLGAFCAAGLADDGARQEARRAALAKRGLLEFDVDGNGVLDAKERAAAVATRRTGSTDAVQTYSAIGAPTFGTSASRPSLANEDGVTKPADNAFAAKRGFDYATPAGYKYKGPGVFETPREAFNYWFRISAYRNHQLLWTTSGEFPVSP